MKNLIALLLLVLCSTNICAQRNERSQLLVKSLKELQEFPNDSIKERNFLNAFPENFPDLLVSLGYTSFSEPLDNYEEYVTAFRNLKYISEKEKMIRLSHLMIGGLWQADGVNQTWDIMQELMRKDADRALGIISRLTESQQILFWQCYWQNPCDDPSLGKDFRQFYSTPGYNRERQVMKNAYEAFKGDLPVVY